MMPKRATALVLGYAIAGHCDGVIDVQSAPGESTRLARYARSTAKGT